MAKRIVFCADGTWQAPLNNTNVYRLYKALAVTGDQVTFYDDGVGADASGLGRILDGAFGQQVRQKIQDGYTKVAHVYETGDEIFLFGFSPGAYTARSLAGMIAVCGLPTGPFNSDCVTAAFNAYRSPANRAAILASSVSCGLEPATIAMVGVWDTVGSLGIPAVFGGVDSKIYGLLDTPFTRALKTLIRRSRWTKKGRSFLRHFGPLSRPSAKRSSRRGFPVAMAMSGAEQRRAAEWMRGPGFVTSRWGGCSRRRKPLVSSSTLRFSRNTATSLSKSLSISFARRGLPPMVRPVFGRLRQVPRCRTALPYA
jgi:hypothetical protein